jgi:hypothetical protein
MESPWASGRRWGLPRRPASSEALGTGRRSERSRISKNRAVSFLGGCRDAKISSTSLLDHCLCSDRGPGHADPGEDRLL